MEKTILYFEKAGPENTDKLLSVAKERIKELGIRDVVVATTHGRTAIKAQEAEHSRGGEMGWRRSDQLVGRTRGDRIVVFTGGPELIGRLVSIRITGATALTLFGDVVPAVAASAGESLPIVA